MFYIYADGNSIYDPTISSYYLFDPHLTLEFGKAGSLEFSIPTENVYYNSLKQMKTIITVMLDDVEIFRGRVLSFETGFNNFKKVYCEGDLAYLVDSVQKGMSFDGTVHQLFRKIIDQHNGRVEDYKKFTVGTITVEDRPIVLLGKTEDDPDESENIDYRQIAINSAVDEWNNTYDYIQTCIIDYCGGYLRTRRVGNTTYIDLLEKYADTATQDIVFGVNLLDLTQEISADELFTVLVPLGDDNLTVASVNNGRDEIFDPEAVETYGRIVRTHVFSNVTDASTLMEDAVRYLALNKNAPLTITVNAIDMHLLDGSINAIRVGDRVRVNSKVHGFNNEYLVCTQIEYDFANPENNQYTFGNPKQTLTQRYRKDKREQNDSYSSGSAGGGGAAAAAGAVSSKKIEELKDEIYKEWIDIDPNNPDGIGSLGGLYREFKNHQVVLERQVGIDFNAEEGNVNLRSLTKKFDDLGKELAAAESRFTSYTGEVDGQLTAISTTIAQVQTEEGVREAKWEVFANETESALRGKADKLEIQAVQTSITGEHEALIGLKNKLKSSYGIDADATTGTINIKSLAQLVDDQGRQISSAESGITTIANQQSASANLFATYKTENDTKIAQITATADALSSNLELKADKVTIDAELVKINGDIEAINGKFETITANKITTTELEAVLANIQQLKVNGISASGNVYASAVYIGPNPSPTNTVATQGNVNASLAKIGDSGASGTNHSHLITENADGTITLGYATKNTQTFNIRATKTYRDGVAAATKTVKITELDKDPNYVDSYNSTQKEYTVHIMAATDSGAVKRTPITVSGTRAYQAGYNDGSTAGSQQSYQDGVDSVVVQNVYGRSVSGYGTDHYNPITHKTSVYGSVKLSNNQNDYDFALDTGTDAYDDGYSKGQSSIEIESITLDPRKTEEFSGSTHKTTIHTLATASNGTVFRQSFTTSTTAYDKGFIAGQKAGADAVDVTTLGKDPNTAYDHDFTKHTVVVPIKAVLSNNKTKTANLTVSTTTHYTAGVNSVTVSSVTKNGDETYNSTTHTMTIPGIVKLSSGANSKTFSFITGTAAYDAGNTAGKNSVTISSITGSVSGNDLANHTISYSATATASNSKTKTQALTISATPHYNRGKLDANNAVTISSIDGSPNGNDLTNHKINYDVTATASTGASKTQSFSINATAHYNRGKEEGGAAVSISSLSGSIASNSLTNHTITYTVTAKASNGAEKTQNFTISATPHYNKGKQDGGNTSISSITASKTGESFYYHEVYYDITAKTSSGAEKTTSITVGVLSHYNDGYRDGYSDGWDDAPSVSYVSGPFKTGMGTTWVRVYYSNGGYEDFTL